jgi:hypothetical protein
MQILTLCCLKQYLAVGRAAHRMRPRRRVIDEMNSNSSVSHSMDLGVLHGNLHSASPPVRDVACVRLARLTPDELLTLLQMEVKQLKVKSAGTISLWLLMQAGILALILLVFALVAAFSYGGSAGSGCSGGWNPFLPTPDIERDSPELCLIANALVASTDPRAPSVMLEAALLTPFLAEWLGSTLDDRLREVSVEHASDWSYPRRQMLVRRLDAVTSDGSSGPILAALHAIEHIGTPEATSAVYRLARHRDEVIAVGAERCLEGLQERGRRVRQERELLRAGTQPSTALDALLRAAGPVAPGRADQLLRPAGESANTTLSNCEINYASNRQS